jgi:hypothetical protein
LPQVFVIFKYSYPYQNIFFFTKLIKRILFTIAKSGEFIRAWLAAP